MENFEVNPKIHSLPAIDVGDIVYVRSSKGDKFELNCLVQSLQGDLIHSFVQGAHKYPMAIKIDDKAASFVGKHLQFGREAVHAVIKPPTFIERTKRFVQTALGLCIMAFVLYMCSPRSGQDCYQPHPRGAEICD